jgi:hypothetical protein
VKSITTSTAENKNIDWDELVKKEARGINDADFGDKKTDFTCQKTL